MLGMSQLLDAISKELGPGVLAQVGQQVGATPQQTQAVVGAAIPMLVSALAKNASQPTGAQALAGALERDHVPDLKDQLGPIAAMLGSGQGGGAAAGLAGLAGALLGGGGSQGSGGGLGALLGAAATAMSSGSQGAALPKALQGDKILGHVLGPSQARATSDVARASGVDASLVARLLPVLAPVVMSALATTKKQNGVDANGLSAFLTSEASNLGAARSGGDDGFGADDLARIGGTLMKAGLLDKLFR